MKISEVKLIKRRAGTVTLIDKLVEIKSAEKNPWLYAMTGMISTVNYKPVDQAYFHVKMPTARKPGRVWLSFDDLKNSELKTVAGDLQDLSGRDEMILTGVERMMKDRGWDTMIHKPASTKILIATKLVDDLVFVTYYTKDTAGVMSFKNADVRKHILDSQKKSFDKK